MTNTAANNAREADLVLAHGWKVPSTGEGRSVNRAGYSAFRVGKWRAMNAGLTLSFSSRLELQLVE